MFAPSEGDVKSRRNFSVHIRPEDFVIPVCHEGMNRAQILYLVLHGLKRVLVPPDCPRRVCVPHGAESGFDPYQAYANLTEHNVYGYIHGRMLPRGAEGDWVCVVSLSVWFVSAQSRDLVGFVQLHENFFSIFGVEKARRVGSITWEERGYMLNMLDDGITDQTLQLLSSGRSAQVCDSPHHVVS